MHKFLFRNRWFALGWVILTLVSAGGFVAEGGGLSKVSEAREDIRARQHRIGTDAPAETNVLTIEEDDEDDAAGTPGPAASSAADDAEAESDDYVVLDDSTPIEEASDEELAVTP